jgi:hypothetical protein
MGFLDEQSPLQKRGADRVLIGVFGGSFAHEFALQADDRLRERLRDAQAFAGKEITLIRLAMPGTKQPQQLMILNYFLALGAEFDYVVNLDGFNDVVLPVTGNLRTHVFYAYPHEWNARMQDLVNPRDSSISYEILRLRALRQRAAQAMLASPLKWSELRRAIWKVRDQLLRRRIVELGVEFVTRRESEGRGFAIDGPKLNPATPREMVPLLVDLWRRSSWQLASLCRSHGIRYLHCLQPNQYVPGSKTLTEGELEHAFAPEHPYKSGVEEGYPALQASRAWLAEHGVRFADLTGLYVNEKVTIYRDWCCHVNGRGYDLVAEAVADELIQLSRTPGTDEFQNGDRR